MTNQQTLPNVIAHISYNAITKCPHCDVRIDLNDYPYDDESTEYWNGEDLLGEAVFGSVDTPAKWEGFSIEYKCCYCCGSFNLTSIEM